MPQNYEFFFPSGWRVLLIVAHCCLLLPCEASCVKALWDALSGPSAEFRRPSSLGFLSMPRHASSPRSLRERVEGCGEIIAIRCFCCFSVKIETPPLPICVAVNVAKVVIKEHYPTFFMANFKSLLYNAYIMNRFFVMSGFRPNVAKIERKAKLACALPRWSNVS